MTQHDYKQLADTFALSITNKGYEGVEVKFYVSSTDENAGLSINYMNAIGDAEHKYFGAYQFNDNTPTEVFYTWFANIPKAEDAAKSNIAIAIGKLLEKADKFNLDMGVQAPLRELMRKLSENILTDRSQG